MDTPETEPDGTATGKRSVNAICCKMVDSCGSAVFSQEHRGERPVGFGDDPEAVASQTVGREQAAAPIEAQVIDDSILGQKVAPIALAMTAKGGQYLLGP